MGKRALGISKAVEMIKRLVLVGKVAVVALKAITVRRKAAFQQKGRL
jgi:hypothetical protein